ncbi:L-dopachrome tautomerase-related protein [Stutzerimonas azotifigens]|uniref:L-dopachrome tautomerase-related protein n=1 Tax=Stutzerimonas azotifigens TaxID=291995 RepID=UPI0005BA85A9|nr:L-dopachrome tautomerase-related protein [Stutzerimonas azotifigens]
MTGLQLIAEFEHQVTGIAVTPEDRVFVNFPRWTEDSPISVAERLADGTLRPYPDEAWNAWRNETAFEKPMGEHFVCVQALLADTRGGLWVLDPGAPGNERVMPGAAKLVHIDLGSDRVTKVIPFPENVALQGSYLNDIRLSPDGRTGYITDSGSKGAIIVVDLDTGQSFRALDGHPSTQLEQDVIVEVDGAPLRRPDGRQPIFASDGIAISNDGATLYWQALTGRTLYRIPTDRLGRNVGEDECRAAVEKVGTTHVADGLLIARDDTLYLTSPGDNAVRRWSGNGTEIVVQDERLRWPDTLSQGPDGAIYVTASHIQDTYWFKPGAPAAVRTALFRFQPPG